MPPESTRVLGVHASRNRHAPEDGLDQVLLTRKGSVIVIDEPEIGLHPAYERRLPELFLQAVRMGQQVIIATHSEVFIAALANAVRQRVHDITTAHVGIWHLERNARGTTAEQIKVSERGYLDRWVSSFAACAS